ncbi:serine hydrolase domain-containing protein [Phenylobacterium sp.]|uniref:serine hydrolase domain-containing protein n=1 Tax=Phenylobacterium sp. TaxID=1871053 RepID=UPI002B60E228|nr:serine hydrolase domain-containing protein [Phenylobacterium sp.]HLZ75850.1 serine hydrolase domain-containing protein [Phenylobacterium sp.]
MDLNRRASLAGMLALAAAPALAKPAKVARAASPWADVDAKAQAMIAGKLTPGLQVCVRRKGAVVFSKGFGAANLETATPMTPASVCRIGSITKQFTASAILLLAQDGKLSLDDSLGVYLPDFPNASKLRIRRMLSHTSGLGNYTQINPLQFLQMTRTDRSASELVKAMAEASPTLAYEPGTDWRYSNTAFVLLGAVIEAVSSQSYADVFQQRLLTPNGLTHTAVDNAARVVPNRASGYSSARVGASGFDNASFIGMSWPGAAGNLRSTCEDLCAWHGALLGGKVLQADSLKAMLTPVRLNDGNLPMGGPPGKRAPVYYGFGIGLDPRDGKPSVSHNGGIQGFASHLETLTDEQITIATVMNTDGGPFAPKALATAPGELEAAIRKAARAL